MAEPKLCPICGTQNFIPLPAEDHIDPTAISTGDIVAALFLCEAGHLFVTFDDAQIESEEDRRPCESRRLN
jgi:hypothetical protein